MQAFQAYFEELTQLIELYKDAAKSDSLSIADLKKRNERLYAPFLTENYETSFANPDYCYERMGEVGPLLSAVFSQLLVLKGYYYHNNPLMDEVEEYLLAFRKLWASDQLTVETVKEKILGYSLQAQKNQLENRIKWNYCSSTSRYMDVILNEDLDDEAYLYHLNFYVTDNERKLSAHLSKQTQAQIDDIANLFFDAYMRAFPRNNMQRGGRNSMSIYAIAGMERVTRALILRIQQAGFIPFIVENHSTEFNTQFLYDHKEDDGIYLSEKHYEAYLEQLKQIYAENRVKLEDY
jgi:aminopeptidase